MSKIFNKMQVFVCLLCLMQVVVVSSVAIRKKRNSNKVEDVLTNDQASVLKVSSDDKPQSCVSVLRQCKHNQECRETLKTLKAKCTAYSTGHNIVMYLGSKGGRWRRYRTCRLVCDMITSPCQMKARSCNAGMHALQACALVMDKINDKFFNLEEKCICKQHERHCSPIYLHIFNNPCFASIKYLRKNNQMPNTETSTSHPANRSAPNPSGDFVEELLDLLLRNDGVNSSESVTSPTTIDLANKDLRNTKEDSRIEAPMKRAQPNSHNLLFNTASSEPNHRDQENSSDGSLLLYIIIAVVGILVIMLLAVGGGLILYFGWWKKEKNTKKAVVTN